MTATERPQRRLSDDSEDLGLAIGEVQKAIGEAAGIEAPLRRACALSGYPKGDVLAELDALKDTLRGIEKALKKRWDAAVRGLLAEVEYTPPPEDEKDG